MFETLNIEIIENIEKYTETKTFKKGSYLFSQDEVCKNIFWLKQGICRKYYLHDGKEITTELLFEDNFVISAKSFVLFQPTNEFAQAITDIKALVISKSHFDELKFQYPELQRLDLKLVELYAIWLEERLFQFHTQDASIRYLNLLKNQPHYIQQIPLTYIAQFLGVSLETLSRIRSKIAT